MISCWYGRPQSLIDFQIAKENQQEHFDVQG